MTMVTQQGFPVCPSLPCIKDKINSKRYSKRNCAELQQRLLGIRLHHLIQIALLNLISNLHSI